MHMGFGRLFIMSIGRMRLCSLFSLLVIKWVAHGVMVWGKNLRRMLSLPRFPSLGKRTVWRSEFVPVCWLKRIIGRRVNVWSCDGRRPNEGATRCVVPVSRQAGLDYTRLQNPHSVYWSCGWIKISPSLDHVGIRNCIRLDYTWLVTDRFNVPLFSTLIEVV